MNDTNNKLSEINEIEASLRVSISLLDKLMNLAGELVLGRNQLLQGIGISDMKAIELSGQRIDLIASELQEAIMQTRMQPVAHLFESFHEKVEHLGREFGKRVNLVIEGKEVELDKTILETMRQPLECLIENAVELGIESPENRRQAGKDSDGKLVLKAYHDAGQVNVSVSDDGCGLRPESLPDVITDGIEGLGGVIEMNSIPDEGTDVRIKLPLTLAIISSQITSVGKERYAIPQTNLGELLRVPASEIKEKIEMVGDAEVIRLRGELLPLLNLPDMLGIERTYIDPNTGEVRIDRRENVADRRSKKYTANGELLPSENAKLLENKIAREKADRRNHASSALHIAVVFAGSYKYGLIVDQLHDSEEIVVKPVGRHLKSCEAYAGATIMGDGKVALILDILNLAQMAKLYPFTESNQLTKAAHRTEAETAKKAPLVVFRNGETEYFAAPFESVERIERVPSSTIEKIGGRKVVQYRGGALPLYELSQLMDVAPLEEREQQEVIVMDVDGREFGLMVTPPVDTLEVQLEIDESAFRKEGVKGTMAINGRTTIMLDISRAAELFTKSEA